MQCHPLGGKKRLRRRHITQLYPTLHAVVAHQPVDDLVADRVAAEVVAQ
jgi:hypothetical protein